MAIRTYEFDSFFGCFRLDPHKNYQKTRSQEILGASIFLHPSCGSDNLCLLRVTVIIQGIFSTLISTALVRDSVLKKEVEPFSFPFPDVAWWQSMARSQKWKKRIGSGEFHQQLFLVSFFFETMLFSAVSFFSPKQTLSFRYGFEHFAKSLGIIIIRGLFSRLIFFFFTC